MPLQVDDNVWPVFITSADLMRLVRKGSGLKTGQDWVTGTFAESRIPHQQLNLHRAYSVLFTDRLLFSTGHLKRREVQRERDRGVT